MLGRSSRLALWFLNRHTTSIDIPEARTAVAHFTIELCSCSICHLALSVHALSLVVGTLRKTSSKGEEVFDGTITLVVLHHSPSTVQADCREASDALVFHNVAVVIAVQHRKLNLLVATWRKSLLGTMVVGHGCGLCVLKRRLLVCWLGLHAVRAPWGIEHHNPSPSLLKHLQERRVRQLNDGTSFHVAAGSLSLMSDAVRVDDTSPPFVDEALLATASIHSIKLSVGPILLATLMVQ
mmetsp:Transcript_15584/g.35668  ORF Transcript_15584/g.35668 Transcript_15584/m.35668 type:complete len:238 (-) Transcript_15584:251-964(-)